MTRSEKRRAKKQGVVLEVLAAGGSVTSACSVVNVARCTFYDWLAKEEWFDDAVMEIRREVMLDSLGELKAQAYGRYVDEVTVRETDGGVVTTRRHRFVNGKVSALRQLTEQGLEELPDSEPVDEPTASGGDAAGVDAVAAEGAADVAASDAGVVAEETGDVSGFEAESESSGAVEGGAEEEVSASTLRNRRRNERKKLAKARGR